jgi:F0F1-type ATP synthase delta subunit
MPSKLNFLVQELVKKSLNEHDFVDKNLVNEVLVGLNECKPPKHLEILKEFLAAITKKLRFQLVEIEFAAEPDDSVISKLKDKISSTNTLPLDFKYTINKSLIAGFRIRLVDDVFEDSVKSRLSKLSQSFTS